MKELTIKQKAEAYDKALKAAVIAYKDEDKHLRATLERIFPGLKESEDEKIRKEIVRFIQMEVEDEIVGNKWLAWLKKQGNFKSSKWTEGDVVRHGGILAIVTNGRKAMKSNCEQITIQYPDEWVKAETKERKYFFEELEKQVESPVEEYNITGITSGHAKGKLAEIIKDKPSLPRRAQTKYLSLRTTLSQPRQSA